MRHNILLPLVIIIITTSSCSIFPSRSRVYNIEIDDSKEEKDERIVLDANNNNKGGNDWGNIVTKAEQSDKYLDRIDFELLDLKKVSNFTTLELTHVSSCSYDPFDENEEIFIDMNQLKRTFVYPTSGHLLSKYGMRSGRFHYGVDIKAQLGENVYAVLPGVVRLSKYYGAYGNVIVLRHTCGIETVYGHNSKNLVKSGDYVSAGDVIGLGGRTGRASGTHVHFEVRVKGKAINPAYLINTTDKTLQNDNLYITNKNNTIRVTTTPPVKEDNTIKDIAPKKKEDKKEIKAESTTPKTSSKKASVHIVKNGDTLYSIARKNGTTVKKLCQINKIKSNGTLKIGQKIVLK